MQSQTFICVHGARKEKGGRRISLILLSPLEKGPQTAGKREDLQLNVKKGLLLIHQFELKRGRRRGPASFQARTFSEKGLKIEGECVDEQIFKSARIKR